MDLSYLHFPEMFRKKDLHQLKNWTAYSLKKSTKIITISKFTKSEIIKYYQIPDERIVIAYPGYDGNKYQKSKIKNQKYISNIKKKYKIHNDYILFVGTLQPRKNLIRLIEAFKLTIKQLNNLTMNLVIVGKKGWFYEEIFQKVKGENLESRVKFLDYVSEIDMPNIYKEAKCLVLPSLYEGFGIPVIEAMACGIPTVISNTSSLPEVGGDAPIYIDPLNVESIKNGIITALRLNDNERSLLRDKTAKQLSKFSWQKSAKIVLQVLKGIK